MNAPPCQPAPEVVRTSSAQLGTTVVSGLREIWAHKFRSLLTMLGIILGVSSLVAMSALVKGMEKGAREALVAIGGLEKLRVEPQELPIEQRYLTDQAVGITMHDVRALQASAPLVTRISPEMRLAATLSANGRTFRAWLCSGAWPVALEMGEHMIEHGRMFNELDDEMAHSVCVIGTAIRDELWGSPEEVGKQIIPVGETLYLNGVPFTIIGMFPRYESERERKTRVFNQARAAQQPASGIARDRGHDHGPRQSGGFVFRMKNATVYIPLNTMWMKFRSGMGMTNPRMWGHGGGGGGSSSTTTATPTNTGAIVGGMSAGMAVDPRLSSLELKIATADRLPEGLQQIRNVLMNTHKGIEDFAFTTQENWAENIDAYIRNARLSGGLIAGISLLVGGIGIMNIMLASISERVREIGIRKSVGAATSDIFVQILVESLAIAVLGGLAGLAASFVLVNLISSFSPTDNAPIITLVSMAIAFGFSVLVGILAGLFPAIKAARLSPIQALRYE